MHAMMWSMAVGMKIAIALLLISWDTDCLPDLGLLTCIVSERFHRGLLLDLANVQDPGLLFGAMSKKSGFFSYNCCGQPVYLTKCLTERGPSNPSVAPDTIIPSV